MNKSYHVAFIDSNLKQLFDSLEKGKFEDKELYLSISRAIENLKVKPDGGIKISKNLWPREYPQKYQITNLWKYNLPNGWRLMYTLETDEIKVLSIILEWFSHKDYERKFKY